VLYPLRAAEPVALAELDPELPERASLVVSLHPLCHQAAPCGECEVPHGDDQRLPPEIRVDPPDKADVELHEVGPQLETAADSGSVLSITFQIDLSSGIPTGFSATDTFSGLVTLAGNGDVHVGAATLPNSVIDATARAKLATAAGLSVPATVVVDGVGTIDQSSAGGVVINVTLSVTYAAPAVASPTPSVAPTQQALPNTAITPGPGSEMPAVVVLVILALILLGLSLNGKLVR
jgi:hypothetical protein